MELNFNEKLFTAKEINFNEKLFTAKEIKINIFFNDTYENESFNLFVKIELFLLIFFK